MTKNQRPLRIYFACPISPGTDARHEHVRIVSALRPYGRVLTELFVSPGYTGDANETAAAINGRDLDWLVASDILVADITEPSLGVGYEVSKAESWQKPVLCLHRPTEVQVSPMVTGATGVVTAGYDSPAKLYGALATFFFMLKVGSSPTDRVLEPPN